MNPITEFVFDFCILKGAQDERSMSLAKPKKFFLRSLTTRSGRELSAFEDYVHVIELGNVTNMKRLRRKRSRNYFARRESVTLVRFQLFRIFFLWLSFIASIRRKKFLFFFRIWLNIQRYLLQIISIMIFILAKLLNWHFFVTVFGRNQFMVRKIKTMIDVAWWTEILAKICKNCVMASYESYVNASSTIVLRAQSKMHSTMPSLYSSQKKLKNVTLWSQKNAISSHRAKTSNNARTFLWDFQTEINQSRLHSWKGRSSLGSLTLEPTLNLKPTVE